MRPPRTPDPARILIAVVRAEERETLAAGLGARFPSCTLETVASARAAQERAEANRPGLMLVDAALPPRGGPALLRAFRDREPLQGIPVVLLTPGIDTKLAVLPPRYGATALLARPFEEDELFDAIEQVLAVTPMRAPGTGK